VKIVDHQARSNHPTDQFLPRRGMAGTRQFVQRRSASPLLRSTGNDFNGDTSTVATASKRG
jgi:hypothetical protein